MKAKAYLVFDPQTREAHDAYLLEEIAAARAAEFCLDIAEVEIIFTGEGPRLTGPLGNGALLETLPGLPPQTITRLYPTFQREGTLKDIMGYRYVITRGGIVSHGGYLHTLELLPIALQER